VQIQLRDKHKHTLRWELTEIEGGLIGIAIIWDPSKEVIEHLKDDKLSLKEVLLNILPERVAEELVSHRMVHPKVYRHCSILFTDIVNFSKLSFHLDPVSLVRKLNSYFSLHDRIMEEYGIEKIKTIGDSYMSVSGIPTQKPSHAVDCCLAAINILQLMRATQKPKNIIEDVDLNNWSIRVGVHSGPCISGIIGYKKYNFDIWGDSVNIASRMEQAGETDQINISETTYEEVKDFFECSYRGFQQVKNVGEVKMYFLKRMKEEFSVDEEGYAPNEAFTRTYIDRFHSKKIPQSHFPHFIQNYLKNQQELTGTGKARKQET
jgi:class 3 adenylate cyclase